MKFLCWLTLFISLSANAKVFSEDFASLARKESSSLIWNTELGLLHPDLLVYGYRNPSQVIASQTTFSVSDGSHGSFEPATYSQFGTVVGNQITINATQFPILKLTKFFLDSTHTLTSVNGPLVIHSLSTVQIDGVIECQGNDGSPPSGNVGGAGGTGRCGGFSGGDGGTGGGAATSGSDGLPTTGNVTGGGGAIYTGPTAGAGGGGGAAFVGLDGNVGSNSNPPANAGGNPGVGFNGVDHAFTNLNGSAGGGGGSGSSTEGGSGGGAGGGTVIIHAASGVTISSTGAILAYGGNGGATTDGGGGGGGGGGNIKVFTPAHFEVAAAATLNSNAGAGEDPGNSNAGNGGDGSFGRAWVVAGTYTVSGTITNGSSLLDEGFAGFVSGTVQTATSKVFDTGSTVVNYLSATTDSLSSDVTLQVAGSNDNFMSDDSGWINAAAISAISKKRYIKFRVSINNSSASNATFVSNVSITFDPGKQENFAFQSGGGCGLVKNTNANSWLMILLLLLPLLLAAQLRKPKTVRIPVKK